MVRIIAGTLIKVGQGQLEPAEIPKIIDGKNRELAGPTAPARGLALVEINYEKRLTQINHYNIIFNCGDIRNKVFHQAPEKHF